MVHGLCDLRGPGQKEAEDLTAKGMEEALRKLGNKKADKEMRARLLEFRDTTLMEQMKVYMQSMNSPNGSLEGEDD